MTPEEFADLYLQPEFRRFFLTSFRNAQVEPLDYEYLPGHYDLSLLNRFYKREWTYLAPNASPVLIIPDTFDHETITLKINELVYPYHSYYVNGPIDPEEGSLDGSSFRTVRGKINGYLVRVLLSPDTFQSDKNETLRVATWCLLSTQQLPD